MANRSHPGNTYNPEHDTNQAQMVRGRDLVDQPSDIHSQGQATKFLQETGAQAKEVAQSAANMAKGAAVGAANMAQGAAEVVKNTLGMNAPDTAAATNTTTTTGGSAGPRNTGHPSNPSTKM